ncbi:lamin tail domain-containing protein [Streptomyces avicenniae]|uniref:lamin tail domain-containing protein n=1 Tax=Streptomyces avicenniae TaxID=500153 RepID=UPI000DA5F7A9|nr:lamin tail domain-containing protein [Streptomyces avicenniae]
MKAVRLAVVALASACVAVLVPGQAQAAEYSSALKVKGVQYDAPGRDSNSCSSGNTDEEFLVITNFSRTATVNLRGYVVKDAAGNRFTFTRNHTLQPGDYVRLRGGRGTDSDGSNVVYRNNCNFLWNNAGDTIYLYKPSGDRADVHSYTKAKHDRDGNGYVTFHR